MSGQQLPAGIARIAGTLPAPPPEQATTEAAAALAPLAAAIRDARAQHDAEQRAAGRRDGLLEGAAALQDLIDRDHAYPNAAGQSRVALAGAREILLGLADQDPAPVPLLSDRDRLFLSFALEFAADRMASRSNEFDDDDQAALVALRKLAGGEV